jgi:hypothetical protein
MSENHNSFIAANGKKAAEEIALKVSSNPSTTHFGVDIQSSDKSTYMNMKLFDVSGNNVEVKNNLKPGQFIIIGQSVRPGVYRLQVSQGNQMKQLTLIKQ